MKTSQDKKMTYKDRVVLEEDIVPLSILKESNTSSSKEISSDILEEIERLSTPDGKVAIYSLRNISWYENGKIHVGYNILTKEKAALWLGKVKKHIRLATPEEVAREFGK